MMLWFVWNDGVVPVASAKWTIADTANARIAGAQVSIAGVRGRAETGVDGAFAPTVNTTVTLPPSGIFNYTSVTIPSGVTVKFRSATTEPMKAIGSAAIT